MKGQRGPAWGSWGPSLRGAVQGPVGTEPAWGGGWWESTWLFLKTDAHDGKLVLHTFSLPHVMVLATDMDESRTRTLIHGVGKPFIWLFSIRIVVSFQCGCEEKAYGCSWKGIAPLLGSLS